MNIKLHRSICSCILPLILFGCASTSTSPKLVMLISDCQKRENNVIFERARTRLDELRNRSAPIPNSLVAGIEQSLRLDCNAKLSSESTQSPFGHVDLLAAILEGIYREMPLVSEQDKPVREHLLNRFIGDNLKKHGLCSWMLVLAAREESLNYLLNINASQAATYKASHFAYLQIIIKEVGYKPLRQMNR